MTNSSQIEIGNILRLRLSEKSNDQLIVDCLNSIMKKNRCDQSTAQRIVYAEHEKIPELESGLDWFKENFPSKSSEEEIDVKICDMGLLGIDSKGNPICRMKNNPYVKTVNWTPDTCEKCRRMREETFQIQMALGRKVTRKNISFSLAVGKKLATLEDENLAKKESEKFYKEEAESQGAEAHRLTQQIRLLSRDSNRLKVEKTKNTRLTQKNEELEREIKRLKEERPNIEAAKRNFEKEMNKQREKAIKALDEDVKEKRQQAMVTLNEEIKEKRESMLESLNEDIERAKTDINSGKALTRLLNFKIGCRFLKGNDIPAPREMLPFVKDCLKCKKLGECSESKVFGFIDWSLTDADEETI